MKAVAKSKPEYRAPALEKGLEILEVLAASRLPLSQVELAQQLGRSQSEFFRMLTCLEERGYVIREAESGRYKLTLKLYELGHKRHATSLLRQAAAAPMERLAEQIGQACHLTVQSNTSILVLMERMPPQRICLAVGEGATFPLVKTTSGKLLLSRMDEDVAMVTLASDQVFESKSVREKQELLKEIEAMRTSNRVVAKSGVIGGVTDIGTIVGVRGTDTVAVLVVPYLAIPREMSSHSQQYLQAVQACGAEINRNLGISG